VLLERDIAVPPDSTIWSIAASRAARSAAGVAGTRVWTVSSKITMETTSWGVRVSMTRFVAAFMLSSLAPCMEPERSSTRQKFRGTATACGAAGVASTSR
jgi:hypothetical protein